MKEAPNISGLDPSKKIQAVEAAIFLLLILPPMLMTAGMSTSENLTFPLIAASTMLTNIPLLCLIIYFVWRNNESFASIGLTLRNSRNELLWGAFLCVPLLLVMSLVETVLRAAGLSVFQQAPSFLVPSGGGQVVVALLLLIVVTVSEEVIFRGYLIRRFAAVTGSTATALVLSAAVFAVGHGYQGSGGVVGVGILAMIFGAVYLWRGSLVAPMVMHFIQNVTGMILIPLGVLSQ